MKDIMLIALMLILSLVTALVYVYASSNGPMQIESLYRETIMVVLSLFMVGFFVAIVYGLGTYANYFCYIAGVYTLVNICILS